MIPPASGKPGDQWTIILNFDSEDSLDAWQKSTERGQILGQVAPLLEGGDFGETIKTDASGEAPGGNVTEVIFSKIRPGMADRYRAWVERIQAAQARYPGYRGMYLQPPPAGREDGHWTTILRYDTAAHLEAWMNAPERRELLAESEAFIESEELMRLATAFPGWVPIDPMTGKGPPNWKTAMLVLLGLFPVVMLELKFLSPNLSLARHPRLARDLHRQLHQRRGHELLHHAVVRAVVRLVALSGKGIGKTPYHQGTRHPRPSLRGRNYRPVAASAVVVAMGSLRLSGVLFALLRDSV